MANLHEKQAYFDKCQVHDWYYVFSDDHSVYMRGRDREDALVAEAEADKYLDDIFKSFTKHLFLEGPRPERPT